MEKLQQALQKARMQRTAADMHMPRAPSGNTSIPTLGGPWESIPIVTLNSKRLARNLIVSHEASSAASAFDALRTKILLMMNKNGWRRIAVTSPMPSCGKTTIVSNLALGLSRQSNIRTVVMEFDLRNPKMANMLGADPPYDITRMLSGDAVFQDQAVRISDNVAISMAQGATKDPSRFFHGEELGTRLTDVEQRYTPHVMIFDLPPLLTSDEASALLGYVDCAILVARAEVTTVNQIDACEKAIAEQTNVLGVVLNQCRHEDEITG